MASSRTEAVEHYMNAFRTGEAEAANRAGKHLAPEVVLMQGKEEYKGHAKALYRVTGKWPLTVVYGQGLWAAPKEEGGTLVVDGKFVGVGAAPAGVKITFSFDGQDRITRIVQENTPRTPATATNVVSDEVRALVNNALNNGTPMSIAYVDEAGNPEITLRGSITFTGPLTVGMWLRHATGGTAKSVQKHPPVTLLYRDSRNRTTLVFKGKGRIVTSGEEWTRTFELMPEVEQTHDPERTGAALMVDIDTIAGVTISGGVNVKR